MKYNKYLIEFNNQIFPSIDSAAKQLNIHKSKFHYHLNKSLTKAPEAVRHELVIDEIKISVSIIV